MALPIQSVALFLAAALILRAVYVAGLIVFPGHLPVAWIARISIGLGCAFALAGLNRRFLLRDGFDGASLELGIRQVPWLLAGGFLVIPVLLLMAGAWRVLVPFHWETGTLSAGGAARLFAEYFAGNFGEELIFRGYLLLVLQRSVGNGRALAIVAVLFGLFHLPGLAGMAALKMFCTTAVWSVVLALAFIRSGSLWTAVGMHSFGNVILHNVLGMSGEESLFRMKFSAPWPAGYDPGLTAYLMVSAAVALSLWLWRGVEKRR